MNRRPRVLVLAEAANPEWVSVPLVGWSLSRALCDVADVHVVTQIRNRDAIERTGWKEGREFTAIDSERLDAPVYRASETLRKLTGLGWTTSTAVAAATYYYYEHLVWKKFKGAIQNGEYDVVHRVTPLTPTASSLIARKCLAAKVPFVWGPVNGGVPWPSEFANVRRKEGEWLSYVRNVHQWMPGYRSSRSAAAAILVGSCATREQMSGYHDKCVYLPENGIDLSRFPAYEPPPKAGPLRAAFVGRLVPYKGADMLIEAAAPLVKSGALVVDIFGDGPEMESLKRQVASEGLQSGVTLHGWVRHEQLAAHLASAHVFAFPSVREFGGGVVLEAMALGIVPIVVDYAGPAELVTDRTGYRVPIGPRPKIVEGVREVLSRLASDRGTLERLSAEARRRIQALFTWPAKAHQVLEVYRWILGERDKPDFGMPFPDVE